MIEVEPITMYNFDPEKFETRAELVYPDSVLNEMARRVGDKLDEEILARLGYVKVVRCKECKYDTLDHADHDYRETLYCGFHRMDVRPDCFCAWGVRKEEHDSNTTGGDLMSATDELHKLLDKRGVKWEARTSPRGSIWTYWDAFNGHRVYAIDNENGTVKIFGEWDVTPEQAIDATLGYQITENTSDGWHSFKDLYHHRALLFSVIVHNYKDMCWKSKRHHDGKELDWNFIVGIDTPWGQASYHYGMDYWDMFDCKVLERAPYYDGYTADESVARIAKLVELEPSTLGAGTCKKVYLVETSDDLIESWYPIGIYLHRAAADDCAESLRGEHVGIRHFARVVELKVVAE